MASAEKGYWRLWMALFLEDTDLSKRKLRVLFVSSNEGFCFRYRVKWMSELLVKNGYIEAHYTSPTNETELKEFTPWADVIVFQHSQPQYVIKLCEFIKQNKIPQLIVLEFDDDMFNIEPINIGAYRYWGTKEIKNSKKYLWKDGEDGFCLKDNKERVSLMKQAVSLCDLVTVTTPELKEAYGAYNSNIVAIDNYINPEVMHYKPRKKKNNGEPVVIGWQGGDSHYADIASIMPALRAIKQEYKDRVHFKFMGCNFPSLFRKVKGECLAWVRPSSFYRVYSELDIDIALVPLLNTPFNKKKSNIKWLEASFYGIPSLVSNVKPYKQHINSLRNGYLFSDNKQLLVLLKDLIDDEVQRKMIGGMAREEVLNKWCITNKDNYIKWYALYIGALQDKIASLYLQ